MSITRKIQKATRQTAEAAAESGDHWEFGQVKEIKEEDNRMFFKVVMLYGKDGGREIGWHPLRKGDGAVPALQMQYGKLRAGMCCIIHYRGKRGYPRPGSTFIEIIGEGPGCGGESVYTQGPVANESATAPFMLFSGGLLG